MILESLSAVQRSAPLADREARYSTIVPLFTLTISVKTIVLHVIKKREQPLKFLQNRRLSLIVSTEHFSKRRGKAISQWTETFARRGLRPSLMLLLPPFRNPRKR